MLANELSVASRFLDAGYAEIDAPPGLLPHAVPLLIKGILGLVADTDAHAFFKRYALSLDEIGSKNDVGLEHRTDAEHKWYFHHVLKADAWDASSSIYRRHANFIEALETYTAACQTIAIGVANEIDDFLATRSGGLADAMTRSWAVTRVLCYEASQDAIRPDATLHIDRDAITVHGFATHPGLVLFDNDGVMHRAAETSMDRMLVFPGQKLGGFFKGRHGLGCVHGVHDTRRQSGTATEPRIAIVTFVHVALTADQAAWITDNRAKFKAAESRFAL